MCSFSTAISFFLLLHREDSNFTNCRRSGYPKGSWLRKLDWPSAYRFLLIATKSLVSLLFNSDRYSSLTLKAVLTIMLGVPTNVWGHTIFPYLQIRDFQALHCANKHLRAGLSPALITYKHWLLHEMQIIKSNPDFQSVLAQIMTVSAQAEGGLPYINIKELIEERSSRPRPFMLAAAEIAVLLYMGQQSDYWDSFIKHTVKIYSWLLDFDPMTPSLVQYLPKIEAFLISSSERQQGNRWVFGKYFYRFLQEVAKVGRIRSQGSFAEMEKRVRRCEGELAAVEELAKRIFIG